MPSAFGKKKKEDENSHGKKLGSLDWKKKTRNRSDSFVKCCFVELDLKFTTFGLSHTEYLSYSFAKHVEEKKSPKPAKTLMVKSQAHKRMQSKCTLCDSYCSELFNTPKIQ